MRTLNLKNVIYFPSINAVGGVETFCYEMGAKYGKDYDITLLFRNGDPAMLVKIAKTCRVIRYRDGDEIECDVFIFAWGHDILDHVHAKEYIQTFHADYINRHLNPCFDERVTKRFGVSENTTKGIVEHYGLDVQTMYNPYTVKKPRKVLKLVSATRLTHEKGFDRMVNLAARLDDAGIPFHWLVFTDKPREFPNKNVTVLPARLDVLDFIADADYLVQLSDTEGYSYSIVEALSVGTPVIVTEIPVAAEQGVVNGKTGFILPFDMSNVPVDAIYKGLRKFTYTLRESHYETVLAKGKAKYAEERKGTVTVQACMRYNDLELGRVVDKSEAIDVKPERADVLIAKGLAEIAW
jgi:glycosyltransferase involved in cell wall biosynthesis